MSKNIFTDPEFFETEDGERFMSEIWEEIIRSRNSAFNIGVDESSRLPDISAPAVFLNPKDYQALPVDSFTSAPAKDGPSTIFGVPVVESDLIDAGEAVLISPRVERTPLRVEVTEYGPPFIPYHNYRVRYGYQMERRLRIDRQMQLNAPPTFLLQKSEAFAILFFVMLILAVIAWYL